MPRPSHGLHAAPARFLLRQVLVGGRRSSAMVHDSAARSPTLSQDYFEVQRDWGEWEQNLRRVPLCVLALGEGPGGKLETRCVDLRTQRFGRV